MNREINRKFREIRGKCNDKTPEHYPAYCHRAVLDILDILNMMREETAANENAVDNMTYLSDYKELVNMEEAYPR